MALADRMRRYGPPGPLDGFTLGRWSRLLVENGVPVRRPVFLARVTAAAVRNSLLKLREEARYGEKFRIARVEAPIFIIGHWRSGTTHLHNLFTVDDRFAYPNHYQVYHPSTFLATEETFRRTDHVLEARPQDSVRAGHFSPAEDEIALISLTSSALYLGMLFPERVDHYGRYLSFRGVAESEVSAWKDALLWFLRKLSWKYGRPLVLKSPGHTARIRLLLELFPDARFVHIHRNPYAVYQSAEHTSRTAVGPWVVKGSAAGDAQARLLRAYREVYEDFFEQRSLIPPDRYAELAFEDLEGEPLAQLRAIYQALNLPSFERVESAVAAYVSSISGYKKNRYPALPKPVAERVAGEWRRCFSEWGYPV